MKDYALYLFDLDDTLAPFDSTELFPDAAQWFKDNPEKAFVICTNQGGVGLRHWMEKDGFGKPDDYPTEDKIWDRFRALFPANALDRVLVAYAYQSKSSGKWSPTPYDARLDFSWDKTWRKPSPGMLLYAMQLKHVAKGDTLMIGDRDEDEQAAAAAGCDFMWAHLFFNREKPEGK